VLCRELKKVENTGLGGLQKITKAGSKGNFAEDRNLIEAAPVQSSLI